MSNNQAVMEAMDPDEAKYAVTQIAAGLGSAERWDSGMLEWIATRINRALPSNVPACDDGGAEAVEFWEDVTS